VALALAVTLLTLATLIGLKFRADGDWRADTASSVQLCPQQQSPTGAPPHQMPDRGHLASCLTGRQSVRRDPLEVLAAAALTVLAVAEIGYLTRHR
jgi:hypothetical protein